MYFTSLPDHSKSDFDEHAHFNQFGKQNVIFNAWGSGSYCDDHIGCLSFKTVLFGEEWYGVNGRQLAVRPGQFIVLNDAQNYSCRIVPGQSAKTLSIFFKEELARAVYNDTRLTTDSAIDDPFTNSGGQPEFIQTISLIDQRVHAQLTRLVRELETLGYDEGRATERLTLVLSDLIQMNKKEVSRTADVRAAKASTQREIFKRVCIARDYLHSFYNRKIDLNAVSRAACLSVPQLIRQFKSVFNVTPHQYLSNLRLEHATTLLSNSDLTVQEISWRCGFENPSAFGRAFKAMYGRQPGKYRILSLDS